MLFLENEHLRVQGQAEAAGGDGSLGVAVEERGYALERPQEVKNIGLPAGIRRYASWNRPCREGCAVE